MSTLHHLSYPYHISLAREPSLLHAMYKPIYHINSHLSGNNISAPRCDVTETETSFHVDCELPSLGNQGTVQVTWLENNVLVIYGDIVKFNRYTGEIGSAIARSEAKGAAPMKKAMTTFPRLIVHERCTGPFQRSFSFADGIDKLAMTFTLSDGLLRVNIPKAIFEDTSDKVYPQSSTG